MTQSNLHTQLFTEDELDLIYNLVGYALDDDDEDSEIVYSIRNKIHNLCKEN